MTPGELVWFWLVSELVMCGTYKFLRPETERKQDCSNIRTRFGVGGGAMRFLWKGLVSGLTEVSGSW